MSRGLPGRPPKSISVPQQATLRRLVVFTEGSKTEKHYVNHWARINRDRVTVAIDPFHGVPRALVAHAAETRRTNVRESRRQGGDTNERSQPAAWP